MKLTKGNEIVYYKQSSGETIKHLKRLGQPDFSGLTVLDMGCGQGSLCLEIAKRGAVSVIGIDIDCERIEFANESLKHQFPQYIDRINYHCGSIENESIPMVDVIISKDTFEHIIDLESVFQSMIKKLKPNGRLMVGFAPFYHTAYGDHKRTEAIIPWGHLIFPEKLLLRRLNKKYNLSISSIAELGLNKLTISELENLIKHSNLKIELFETNLGQNPLLRLYRLFSKVPLLRPYFTHNCYFILRKSVE